MKSAQRIFVALVIVLVVAMGGCKDTSPSVAAPGLGGVSITKYVAIGNSITAGYQSNGLYQSAQVCSFPNLIAGQLKAAGASIGSFEQGIWSDPGSYDATGKASRYEIISLNGPVIAPKGLAPGTPTNLALARPFDNLGIPGAVVQDFLDTTDFTSKSVARSNPFFAAVLRSSLFGKSVLAQATALHPDLVTFWLGNNNVLGFATSGGASPNAPTSSTDFATFYTASLASLHAALPAARIVVATIPDVTTIPFFTTVGPKIKAAIPAGIKLRYQKHGNASLSFDSTAFTESTPPLICLTGIAYASLLGTPTGKWYRDNPSVYHGTVPSGIDTTKPFGFHPQNPWPDALVLDADEQATAAAAVSAFNGTIVSVANANGAGVVDINAFFTSIKAHGYAWAGEEFTADYITGGLFSLDGVHPSSRGAGVIANQFIRVINQKFGTNLSYVNLSALPGIPAGLSKTGNGSLEIPPDAFSELQMLWGTQQ